MQLQAMLRCGKRGSCVEAPASLSYYRLTFWGESEMKIDVAVTTRVSTKGQVILPKAVRDRNHWPAGTELIVEDTPEGVLLKAKPQRTNTNFAEVFGRLGAVAKAIDIDDTEAALLAEARQRHAGD